MHYYRFSISDYRADTAHLTPMEHYIYRQLIDWYYLDEKPIPKKTQTVLRRLKLDSQNEESLSNVLEDFFEEGENGWIHNRIEADIAEYQAKAKTNQQNGKKGGRPKKQEDSGQEKPKKTQSVSNGNPNKRGRNPNHLTNKPPNHTPPKPPQGGLSFADFWETYPKKVAKIACEKKWKAKKLNDKAEEIIADVEKRKSSHRPWRDGYTPNPLTYLSQERWNDEIEPVQEGHDEPKAWHETADGIEAKAQELGVAQQVNEPWPFFRDRVLAAAGVSQ